LLFRNNYIQRIAFVKATNVVSGSIYKQISSWIDYLNLREQNLQLQYENTELRNKLQEGFFYVDSSRTFFTDLSYQQRFVYLPAKVINNTVNKQFNFITIDRGLNEGVEEGMAVMGTEGIVGVVYGVSERFATVMPIINRNFRVSAKFKKNNHFGSLGWDGRSYRHATLNEISLHVPVSIGDTIVVSGFSGSFREGRPIGTCDKIEQKDGSFFTIRVLLTTDFRKLYTVTVIEDIFKREQQELEKQTLEMN